MNWDQALIDACRDANLQAISAAITAGANINQRHRKRGTTPLMHVLRSNTDSGTLRAAVEMLLKAKAKVGVREWKGKKQTPLILACAWPADENILAIVERFLGMTKDFIDYDDSDGKTALSTFCCKTGGRLNAHDRELVGMLLEVADANAGGVLPAVVAAKAADRSLFSLLIHGGAMADKVDASGESALSYLVKNGKWGGTIDYLKRRRPEDIFGYWGADTP